MRSKRSGLQTTVTSRDEEMFLFLWKWKLATLKTLAHVFFGETSLIVAYHRLCKLRRAGFLRQRSDETGRIRIWTLDRKGFAALINRLPELEEYGFASENIEHDLLVNALHIGEWAKTRPSGTEAFTEQQLRRYNTEMYPVWVPATKNHRPDGYWHIAKGKHHLTIALEVELSVKSKSRYEAVAKFYDLYDSITRVIWLVPTKQVANKISKAATGTNFYRSNVHNFVILEDFKMKHWDTEIFSGPNRGSTISEILNQNLMQTLIPPDVPSAVKESQRGMSSHLLDMTVTHQNRSKSER